MLPHSGKPSYLVEAINRAEDKKKNTESEKNMAWTWHEREETEGEMNKGDEMNNADSITMAMRRVYRSNSSPLDKTLTHRHLTLAAKSYPH